MKPQDRRAGHSRYSLPKLQKSTFPLKERRSQQIPSLKQQTHKKKGRLSHQISMKSTKERFFSKIELEQLKYVEKFKTENVSRPRQSTQIKEQIFLKSKKSLQKIQSFQLPLINSVPAKNKSQLKLSCPQKRPSLFKYQSGLPEKGKNQYLFNSLHTLLSKRHSPNDYLKMLKTIPNFTLQAKKAQIRELSAKYRLDLEEQSKVVRQIKQLQTIPHTSIANWNRVFVNSKTLISQTTNFVREINNIDSLHERANQSLEMSFQNGKQLLELSFIIKSENSKTKKG